MHDLMTPLPLLLIQEGDRQLIIFADEPAAVPRAVTASVAQDGTAEGPGAAPTGNSSGFWIMIALLFLFMWFFVIRPENKRQKERRNFQSALKKGDKVVTMGGLHGSVASLDEATVTLKVADDLRLKFDRVAVARHTSPPAEAKGDGAKDGGKKG
jgi:preprotein translocase subunit YajC